MKKMRVWLLGLALLLALSCLPGTARAYDLIDDLQRQCSLTVHSQYEGVTYELYRVCTVNELARFTPAGRFRNDASISNSITSLIGKKDWTSLVTTLTGWLDKQAASGNAVACQAVVTTGEDYRATAENLPVGLYLVRGRDYKLEDGYYTPADFMICLPNWVQAGEPGNEDGEKAAWVYDVAVENKGGEVQKTVTSLKAVKAWRGDGGIARPTAVTVQLLRKNRETGDVEVIDEITLDAASRWEYVWHDLNNADYEWSVVEVNVPDGYTVEAGENGINVVITNTYTAPYDPDPDDPPPDRPGDRPKNDPDSPPPGTPGNPTVTPPEGPPDIPGEDLDDPDTPLTRPPAFEETEDPWDEDEPEDEEDLDDDDPPLARLPQTGVLWWPVPVLTMSGMFLFILGWGLRRRERNYEE